MFTFSREFLETFDRRLADLMDSDGREFVLGARAWLTWLQTDVRTRTAHADLISDTEAARQSLAGLMQKYVPDFVACRQAMAAVDGIPADPPPPRPPGPQTPGDMEGHAMERFRFRHFDRLAEALASEVPRFLPFDALTDPLKPLREVISAKRGNAKFREHPDGSVTKKTEEEMVALYDALESCSHGSVDHHYIPELEAVCFAFHVSPGRALRILEELLLHDLTNAWGREERWFAEPIAAAPGLNSTFNDCAAAVLSVGRRRSLSFQTNEDEAKRKKVLEEWCGFLKRTVRSCGSGLRQRLGERALLVTAVDRFRLRCELHDSLELRDLALAKGDGAARQAEKKVTQRLARYLFDAGFDTYSEVTAGEGRADLVQFGGVYVEAKQVSSGGSERARIIKGYAEATDVVRQFRSPNSAMGVKAIVLAIYVFDGPMYELPRLIRAHGDVPEAHPIVIDIRDAAQRGAQTRKVAVAISEEEFIHGAGSRVRSPPPHP